MSTKLVEDLHKAGGRNELLGRMYLGTLEKIAQDLHHQIEDHKKWIDPSNDNNISKEEIAESTEEMNKCIALIKEPLTIIKNSFVKGKEIQILIKIYLES